MISSSLHQCHFIRPPLITQTVVAPFPYSSINATPYPTLERKPLSSSTLWNWDISNQDDALDSDERYTPDWILNVAEEILGTIDLDPAADPKRRVNARIHFTKEDDGLSKSWSGRIFLNPPFTKTTEFIKHLSVYCLSGRITEALVLIPVTSLSNKSSGILMRSAASAFVLLDRNRDKGNSAFLNENYELMRDTVPLPLALVYVGDSRTDQFLSATKELGVGCLIHSTPENQRNCFCSYCGKSFKAKRSTAKFCGTTCRVESHRKRTHAAATSR